jgi:hypothetical protein
MDSDAPSSACGLLPAEDQWRHGAKKAFRLKACVAACCDAAFCSRTTEVLCSGFADVASAKTNLRPYSFARIPKRRRETIMRMLLNVVLPHEPFNTAVRNGTAGDTLGRILDAIKPEAVYFTEQDGYRGAILIVNVNHPSEVPAFAEPWFLNFNADCKFRIVMSPEDLQQAGLEELGKKWG